MTFVAIPERYDRMRYNRVGRSGLKLPALSLGLWHNFGHDRPLDTQRAIVRRAFDLGITHFDLANNYGPPAGSAEENFGRILATDLAPYRDELIISSKAGYDMWPGPYGDFGSRKYLLSSLDQSLGRLGLEYVDIFYSHRPDPETPDRGDDGRARERRAPGQGAVRRHLELRPRADARRGSRARGRGRAAAHPPAALLDVRPAHRGRAVPGRSRSVGAASIVFSPLAQGLLTDRYLSGDVPADSRAATSRFLSPEKISDEYLERMRGLDAIAKERGQSIAQLALSWVLREPLVASALIGASSVAQLEQNVAALDAAPLDDDEIARIEPFAAHGTVLG